MKTRFKHLAVAVLSASLLSSLALAGGQHAGGHSHEDEAIGMPGVAAQASRTVRIDMNDTMRFSPSSVKVKQGETLRFLVKNSGKLEHELVLGTEAQLKAHAELMRKTPEMAHADENMVSVAPGETGEIVWQFTQAGKVDFACLQPGHYEAGMKGAVKVAGTAASKKAQHHDHDHDQHQH